MKNPSQEDLLGYVLGALDADEHNQVQERIDSEPGLEEKLIELRSSIAPLEHLGSDTSNRPGLARRTIEAMAVVQKAENQNAELPIAELPKAKTEKIDIFSAALATRAPDADAEYPARISEPDSRASRVRGSSWSLSDVLVTVAVCTVLAALIFPAMAYSRNQAKLQMCQSNLATLGQAFISYSNMHDGRFPEIPKSGNLSTTGGFAPLLKEANLISDGDLVCAGVDRKGAVFTIPMPDQIRNCSDTRQLDVYRRQMAGDYGYSLGYMQNREHVWPRNLGRAHRIILADSPSSNLEGRRSANHGGNGQNCLFEDGHWRFVTGHASGEDAIYENEYGIVAPGVDANDNVIGASHLSPTRFATSSTIE